MDSRLDNLYKFWGSA